MSARIAVEAMLLVPVMKRTVVQGARHAPASPERERESPTKLTNTIPILLKPHRSSR